MAGFSTANQIGDALTVYFKLRNLDYDKYFDSIKQSLEKDLLPQNE